MKYETIEREFSSMKQKVEYILEMDPKSRNSDIRLFSKLLEELTPFRIINVEKIIKKLKAKEIFFTLDLEQNLKDLTLIIEENLLRIPNLQEIPHFETIRRVRQKIQNEDERFLPTSEEVARKRRIREVLIKEYIIKNKTKEELCEFKKKNNL